MRFNHNSNELSKLNSLLALHIAKILHQIEIESLSKNSLHLSNLI